MTRKNVVPDYIKRIVDDIKLERDLKIVIDCGNGIGGVCAADTLRAIGAEVLPLFDEVDGTFPNHHPDPSDPENLQDLIESVRLMDADLGLAFDGDADRLGVVTLGGNIIFPDRVMMLLALDVLDRNPGATIIYDVKCTGHDERPLFLWREVVRRGRWNLCCRATARNPEQHGDAARGDTECFAHQLQHTGIESADAGR
jgi:phosphomannomutase/phosphoglucomutase